MIAACGPQRQSWDVTDLRRRLCHALDIAGKAVERLAEHGYTDAEEPANKVPPEKIVCETAILLYAAAAAGRHADTDAAIDAVARALIPHARSKRMLLGICLEPSLALDYAEAHICLSRLGYPDAGFDGLLRQARAAQAGFARERVPHRVLEQRWIGGLSTGMGPPDLASSPPVSVLNQPLDVLNGSREHVYAFTHALMYVRDFNIKPRRLPRSRAMMLAEAEAALARCLDEDDYDLAGEVLMAWPLTGTSWSAAAAFGFRVLAKVEDETGHLPAPSTRQDRLDKLEGAARTDYWLATAYHTIYVMGLLCAAALQPARAPPLTSARRPAKPEAADAVLRFLDDDGRSPRWRQELDRISSQQRAALAGFLLSVALIRKVRRRDFGAVHALLRTGYALGLADGPASSQSAEMLERLAAFEQITGVAGADVDWQPSSSR
ncbi:MAG TPA: hypothetical protein VFQ87_07545 [Bradyrhizobium sp.]|nr:hypothetical protein [Bradyrhizobium sp.]